MLQNWTFLKYWVSPQWARRSWNRDLRILPKSVPIPPTATPHSVKMHSGQGGELHRSNPTCFKIGRLWNIGSRPHTSEPAGRETKICESCRNQCQSPPPPLPIVSGCIRDKVERSIDRIRHVSKLDVFKYCRGSRPHQWALSLQPAEFEASRLGEIFDLSTKKWKLDFSNRCKMPTLCAQSTLRVYSNATTAPPGARAALKSVRMRQIGE